MAEAMAQRVHSNARLAALVAAEALARLSPARFLRFSATFSGPDRLLTTPPAMVPGNPVAGAALYGGTFTFNGITAEANGRSIFDIAPPSPEWADALHAFSWLPDLAAADTTLARAYGRTLIEQWAAFGRTHPEARKPEVSARRLLNWLTHARFVLRDAEPVFRRRFLRGIARQAARLHRDIGRAPDGLARLSCAVAVTQAGLCLPDAARLLANGSNRLASGLRDFVLPDGGVTTRNPHDLLMLAADLVPLAATFSERGLEAPRELTAALDRVVPMLRFFRHGDGALALFNGMGATPSDLLDAVIARDDVQGRPVLDASYSGYQRLEGGDAVVIVDAGKPPPLRLSRDGHAGTLSFEFSSQASRIVVNCGAPEDAHPERRMAARKTAAHSTAIVGDASSSRFVTSRFLKDVVGPLLREGPHTVEAIRDGTMLRASHDGYAARFGLIHERTLVLSADGDQIDGADVLRPIRQRTGADISIAFHLHPDVRATLLSEDRAVLLSLPNGERWLFSAEGHPVRVEESIFFASPGGPRRSEQIVLRLGRKAGARVAWSFVRAGRDDAAPGLS